jgi:hypothetical protein
VKPFDIRVMSALDLARALDWAAAEGWNPGLGDARAFQIADPQGFLVGLCERAGPGVVVLDVPETNARAVQLAESLGMVPAFETARMYTGADPEIDATGLFGVTTFELG